MNSLVKIIRDDDGYLTENDSWHLVDPANEQGSASLCTAEFFGLGESRVEFETRERTKGGITCEACLKKLHIYKRVRL